MKINILKSMMNLKANICDSSFFTPYSEERDKIGPQNLKNTERCYFYFSFLFIKFLGGGHE